MFLFLFFLWQEPQFKNPEPLGEGKAKVEENRVRFERDHMVCEVLPLDAAGFASRIEAIGFPASYLDRFMASLKGAGIFFIQIENRGEKPLIFNPDQVLLRAGRGPVAIMVDMATFWPESLPHSDPTVERFARIFTRGTVTLEPGEQHSQLVVFRTIKKKLPRRVTLQINRLYYGISDFSLACRFEVRYRKK